MANPRNIVHNIDINNIDIMLCCKIGRHYILQAHYNTVVNSMNSYSFIA